jgi:glycosyltransferase involved in cell wall biosynthesis
MLKIALYYPWIRQTGGIERTILEIVKRSRHRWTLFTNRYDPETTFPGLADLAVVELERVSVDRDFGSVLRSAQTIRRQRVDLSVYDALMIHSEGWADLFALNHHSLPTACYCYTPLRSFYDPVYRARQLAAAPRKKLLFSVMEVVFKRLARRAWRHYDHIFVISEEVRQRVIGGKLATPDRLETLNAGVDLEACVPVREYQNYFLLPGRITWTKNLELGIEAFRRFRRAGQDPFRLVIAGMVDTKNRDYLEALWKLAGDDTDIEFVLSPTDEELRRLYQRCFGVLFTAINEDWGLVPLEAMAYEKPVVAVDQGGPRETVVPGKTGLLVEPDAESFADGLRTLADAPDRAKAMGRSGREWVRRYSWSHFVNRIDACMEELVTYPSRGTDGTLPRFGLKW